MKTHLRKSPFRRLALEPLESRDVPSTSLLAVGADAGGGPRVTVLDRSTGAVVQDFFAYDSAFTGGVRVAVGDLNGDGTPDVVTAPGKGMAPVVKVFDGKTGDLLRSFTALDPNFTGGVNLAVGDVNKDGVPDIVTAADAGGGPRVEVFDGKNGNVLNDFFAFASNFSGGVRVAVGDVNGDGKGDIIAGAGAGGGPAVSVFDGATGNALSSFFAFGAGFTGGVFVGSADLNADGKDDVVVGAGAGGGPEVTTFDGATSSQMSSFFAYDPSFTGGVHVAAFASSAFGRPDILVAPGAGTNPEVRIFDAPNGNPAAIFSAFTPGFLGGAYVAGSSFAATAARQLVGNGNDNSNDNATGQALITLHLNPLDINLIGLEVQTNAITVTISAQQGSGELLGNLLTTVSSLLNLQGVNKALNNVLGSVVTLLNSASLNVSGVDTTSGTFSTSTTATTTPVLNLAVAPVHLNLLGALVDTSPIHLTITAHSGDGLVLGNVVTDLANLFNPPLPSTLNLDDINSRLQNLLNELNAQIPGIPSAPVTTPTTSSDAERVLSLTVPPINLNLLGLNLKTNQIQVNADAVTGNGDLLGNVLTTLLNTLGATPQNLNTLSSNLNAILAKVVGVLNASSLTLAPGAVNSLSQVLQTLALPDLVNTSGTTATAPVLNLTIASSDGKTPPVNVNLLGLNITTSNIQAQLLAQTGDGQILGNLLYNVAHLLDPGGSLNLLTVLNELGL